MVHWVKNLVLSLLGLGLQLGRGFDPWPGNFHMPQALPLRAPPQHIKKSRIQVCGVWVHMGPECRPLWDCRPAQGPCQLGVPVVDGAYVEGGGS